MSRRDPGAPNPPQAPEQPILRRPALVIVLTVALIASLGADVVLGVRVRNARDKAAALEQQIQQLQNRLDTLRGRISGSGSSDPLGRIAAATAQLRGLNFKTTVKPELLSPAELAARVQGMFTHDNTKVQLNGTADVLATFGLLPAHYDLYDELKTLQGEQVEGFYDSKSKRLVVGASNARNPTPFDQVVLAHEYTHALADQHFGLGLLGKLENEHADDAASAVLALYEGDATFTMNLYRDEVLTGDQQQQYIQEASSLSFTAFDAAPQYIQDILQFPYLQGLAFVTTLHDRGGFDLVDQAYRDPPVSTEQIMHPARYLDSRDNPTAVHLPDVRRALGTGWTSIETGGIGEYDVLELLEHGGGTGLSVTDSRAAADGWAGGMYGGYRSSDGVLVSMLTAWDSESQAREAEAAFARWLPVRYPGGTAFDAGRGQGWQSTAGAGEVVRSGSQVLLLLGPASNDLTRARAAFGGF